MTRGFIPPKLEPPPAPRLAKPPKQIRVPVVLFALVILAGTCTTAVYFLIKKEEVPQPHFSSSTNPVYRPKSTTTTIAARIVSIAPPPSTQPTRLNVGSETKAEIQAFLESWSSAINENSDKAVGSMFDAPRDFEEMRSLGVLDGYSDRLFARFSESFTPTIGQLICNDPLIHFRELKIGKVYSLSDPGEFLIYSRAWNLDSKREFDYRWWLRKSGPSWKIYDYQCLDGINLRISRILAFAVGKVPQNGPAWCDGHHGFRNVIKACNEHDNHAIVRALYALEQFHFPAEYESILLATRGVTVSKNDHAEAIRLFTQALAKNPDNPGIYIAQARAFWMTKQYENSAKATEAYLDLTGDNALLCGKLGNTYEELHQLSKAAEAYRRGLFCDPNSRENREGLARVNR